MTLVTMGQVSGWDAGLWARQMLWVNIMFWARMSAEMKGGDHSRRPSEESEGKGEVCAEVCVHM